MPKVSRKITDLYLPADESFVINDNDPDLLPITIPLQKCPSIELIDGYGLHPDEQKFRRPIIPEALQRIQKESSSIAECWQRVDLNKHQL